MTVYVFPILPAATDGVAVEPAVCRRPALRRHLDRRHVRARDPLNPDIEAP